jgi:hypothetical protein
MKENDLTLAETGFELFFSQQDESCCEIPKQASNNFMEIQNVTFAKKHESLGNTGFREISSRENQ